MTERASRHVHREARQMVIGPSALRWKHDGLLFDIDERSVPLAQRVRGQVRVHPHGLSRFAAALDTQGRHRWGPLAPSARVEVMLTSPALCWKGHAYLDSNEGDEPIECGFERWDWLRAPLPGNEAAVVYDITERGGQSRLVAARFLPDGRAAPIAERTAPRALPPTPLWRINRQVRSPADSKPSVTRTLEDTPFYARSLVRLDLAGNRVEAVHETLQVDRLRSGVVQWLLPWRMPRVR